MKKRTHSKAVRGWLRRHRISLLVITGALLLLGGSIAWYGITTNSTVSAKEAELAAFIKEADAQKKKLDDAREVKLKAEKEAAAKKAAEEAKEAAEAARNDSSGGTSGSANSKACNASSTHINPSSIDVVVNKKHCMQPVTYAPGDLVTSNGATLSAKAVTAFNNMYAAAAAAGQGFYVTSSYRSYSDQVSTYNYWVSVSGQAGADTYSARPGYSEHQTGFVIDVAANGCVLDCFGSTSQYQWFQQHAADYGFIQRYYKGYEGITGYVSEEWHYRYVGVTVAKDMQAKGIKTLEQYWGLPGGDY